jgi:hypothetical protein
MNAPLSSSILEQTASQKYADYIEIPVDVRLALLKKAIE